MRWSPIREAGPLRLSNRWADSDEAWPKSLQGIYLLHPEELTLVGAP